ncbi:leucyl aminopeptidase [Thalassobaculum sp.]|uniref:leucyl aminopeptidase n=1 Tax=Thalassobaculum sp. TaxID=2022740 RepID=UPI0032EFAB55
MKIAFAKIGRPKKGAVVASVLEGGKLSPTAAALDEENGGLIGKAIAASRFTGKAHQSLTVFTPAGRVLLYGLGDPTKLDPQWAEAAGGGIYAALASSGEKEAAVVMDRDDAGCAERAAHVALGAVLRSYRFDKYRTTMKKEDRPTLEKLTFMVKDHAEAKKLYDVEAAIAEGVAFTRDLVSEPPNVLYPESFAEHCVALKKLGVDVEVLGEKEMAKLGMGALLGVGQGSRRESKMVVMRWNGGAKGDQPVAFVGKGVCFDTGGISIKPAGGMEDMKFDMGGAGVVSGLMKALAGRKAKANVIGVIGLVENMPDGNAQRPSDVVTSMSGQTIEIINTDAEGRLVLADALWYTQDKYKPAFMVDLATLTGAMMVSLGEETCGYFANDDKLSDALKAASDAVAEPMWRMPLGDAYNKQMDSDIADMKNAGPRWGGAITAACFLERFVDKTPWIHMDIAGVAWSRKDRSTTPKGASGFGVRALDRLVRDYVEKA